MSRRNAVIEAQRARALVGLNVAPLPAPRAKSAARVAAGHEAHEHGDALERVLARQHEEARKCGRAHIRKVGAPVRVGRGGLPVEWDGTGPADYQGILRGGRAIAVEAKSRASRLALSEIPEHQRADLDAVAALGGLALLVVEIREAQLVAVVPWHRVPWVVARTAKAVTADELRAWPMARAGFYFEEHAGRVL